MEDENGLDLSLSLLSWKSTKFKVKNDSCSEGSNLIHDSKNFLDCATPNEGRIINSQNNNQSKQEENLVCDLSSSNEELTDKCNRRKNLFDEISSKKQHEIDHHLAKLSITEGEGSTEDVADSENAGLYEGKKEN